MRKRMLPLLASHVCSRSLLLIALTFIGTLVLLAGCGQITVHAPVATATRTPTSAPAQMGCPRPTQHVAWPSPPTVLVTPAQQSTVIQASLGATVEVALPMGHMWAAAPGLYGPQLRLDEPAGYGDERLKSCIWHYTAMAAGPTVLPFTMGALCPANAECPQYLASLVFTVQVNSG